VTLPSVTLAPHRGVASFSIYGRDIPNGNDGCVTTNSMRLTLPGSSRTFTTSLTQVSTSFTLCDGQVAMHPIVPGRSGDDPPLKNLFHV
jgi:hypothetical protein